MITEGRGGWLGRPHARRALDSHRCAFLDACMHAAAGAQYSGERAIRIADEMRRMGPWRDRDPRTHIFPMTAKCQGF